MKGQYKTVMEVLFFGIGILLTIYVAFSFSSLREDFTEVSVLNQLDSVANVVKSGIIKVSEQPNAIIRAKIPITVSEQSYIIRTENNNGQNCAVNELCNLNLTTSGGVSIRKEIFNTADRYSIIGTVRSSDEIIEIIGTGFVPKVIEIKNG
jgi:hypothetical protein